MATQYDEITEPLRAFIGRQRIFFVATAATDGKVNLSPKGQDSLRVTGPNEVLWMNLTGSGNETAAHLLENDRMTLMWCAFEGAPMILRVYGTARAAHPRATRSGRRVRRNCPRGPGRGSISASRSIWCR